MNEITDERLKEFSDQKYIRTPNIVLERNITKPELVGMADELITLRQRLAELEQERDEWRQDAERLNQSLCAYVDYDRAGLDSQCYDPRKALSDHAALVDKYKKA